MTHRLLRIANKIARDSRRGRGNVLYFSPRFDYRRLLPVSSLLNVSILETSRLPIDEAIMFYRGTRGAWSDSPVCYNAKDDVYAKHPDFDKLAHRFKLFA